MICGITSVPRFTNEVRSWLTNRCFIIIRYCTGSGRSKPNDSRTCASVAGSAFLPAMRAAGSTPGVAKKIRKTSTLIANRTSTAGTEPPQDVSGHQAPPRSRAFGSSASRTPSPNTLSATAVSATDSPAAIVIIGRV